MSVRMKALLAVFGATFAANAAMAQVPVIDNANLQQASQISQNTQQILSTDQAIQQLTQKTLAAVTGDRTSVAQGSLAQMALGGGFSMAQAPSLGSVISGGALSFTGMGSGAQNMVSQLINGLNLVKSLSGLVNGQTTGVDTAYQASVNLAGTLAGLVQSTQQAAQQRSAAFTQGAQQIGTAPDLKGSLDQNSQIEIQNAQTLNEAIGAVNSITAGINQQNIMSVEKLSAIAAVNAPPPAN